MDTEACSPWGHKELGTTEQLNLTTCEEICRLYAKCACQYTHNYRRLKISISQAPFLRKLLKDELCHMRK